MARTGSSPSTSQIVSRRASLFKRHSRTLGHPGNTSPENPDWTQTRDGRMISRVRDDLPTGTVTFLFTDIEGSTKLLHELGAEAYSDALAEHGRVIREACTADGGVEVDTQGDAFFFAFTTATSAVNAAAAITSRLDEGPMRVRVGLHTGTPLVRENGYVGDDVHRAARIAASGHGGQVLLSSVTAALVSRDALRDLGVYKLKDFRIPERIFQLGGAVFPPLETPPHANLPVASTRFLGRESDLSEVRSLLSRNDLRLLTLTGTGGSGKSRLGLEAAARASDRFPWGAWLVQLAPVSEGAEVASTISEGIAIEQQPGRPVLDTLVRRLQDREMLIVLDNCDDVVEAVAEAVSALQASCPGVRIIATSRQRLGLSGEYTFVVKPLVYPVHDDYSDPESLLEYDSIRLFVDRARQADLGWELDEGTAPHVVRICAGVDGLPLAIELAAARTRVLTVSEIADRLGEQLALLSRSFSEREARRHGALRATIDWSYEQMQEDERRLFRRLSVFRGGANLLALESTCAHALESSVLDALDGLVAKSVVQAESVGAGMRYRLLEPLRQYAGDLLVEEAEETDALARHWSWFEEFAKDVERDVRGPSQLESLGRAELDYANLSAALHRAYEADAMGTCFSIAGSLSWFMFLHSHVDVWERWLPRLLEQSDRAEPRMLCRLLLNASQYAWEVSRLAEARAHATRALEIASEIGADTLRAWSHAYLALIGILGRETSVVEDHLAMADELFQRRRILGGVGFVSWLRVLGSVVRLVLGIAGASDDPDRLWLTTQNLVDAARQLGDRNLLGHTLWTGAEVAGLRGDGDGAWAHAAEGTQALYELGNRYCLAHNLVGAARVAMLRGEPVKAAMLMAGSDELRGQLGVSGSPMDILYSEQLLLGIQDAIDRTTLDRALAEGRLLSVARIVELATS